MEKEGLISHEDCIQDFVGILGAGTDTTSKCLTQIFWRLKKHPDIFQKLEQEIDEKFPMITQDSKNLAGLLTIENIDELSYLPFFIKECLRS